MSDHMSDYQLVQSSPTEQSKKQWTPRVLIIAALALTLVLGAFYAPLLWNTAFVSAQTGETPVYTLPTNAPTVEVNQSLLTDQDALASLYDQVKLSVVNIQVTARRAQVSRIPGFSLPEGEAPLQQGQGSGFIYDNEGHIVTNNHVVEGAEEVTVIFSNGFWADAEVVATDAQADLAVIKVTPLEGMDWRPLALAEPDNLRVGHSVVAIGNPFGLAGTMTTGIVSALSRDLPVGDLGESRYSLPDIIQTDAAINPGNSGGPLLNLAGQVVGVNFAIESPSRSNSGVGFTIPVSIVRRVVPALIANGKFDYAYLGLSGQSISPALSKLLELPSNRLGVYVAQAVEGGPAAEAGVLGGNRPVQIGEGTQIQAGGDVVSAINDVPVYSFEDLVGYLVTQASPGETVTLTLLRGDEEVQVDVVLGTRPSGLQAQQSDEAIGEVNARAAIRIAEQASQDLLQGEIIERTVVPDQLNGQDVWVVELSTESQVATVVVDRATGEVVEASVE